MKTRWNALIMGALMTGAFAHTINTGGLSGDDNTYTAYSIGSGSFQLGLSLKGEYGNEALHQQTAAGVNELRDVYLYGEDVFGVVGLTNWMDLAMDLPFYQDQITGFDNHTSGAGDLSASLKIMHPGMKSDALIRLAYIMRATFPTGNLNAGYFPRDPQFSRLTRTNTEGTYSSQGYELNPMLAWTFDFTRLKNPAPWLMHVNFGMDALFYTPRDINIPQENSAMQGGLALEWLADRNWSLFLDFYGKSRLLNVEVGNFMKVFTRDKVNLALGTKNSFANGLMTTFAVEAGLSTQENFSQWSVNHGDGLKTYGAQPTPIVGAFFTIGFGQTGKNADSDFDGIPNSLDKCPYDAEDFDGYQDADGCPDPVHVPTPPVIIKDTVIVIKRDTLTVVHNDTIKVSVPDTVQYHAQQDPNAIFGFGKTTFPAINFMTASNELDPTSFKTLNDIAQSLKNFPGVTLQVLGYTDNTGSDATNKALSAKRAQAVVEYLVKQGITANRLEAAGMGTENPVKPNTTADGRKLNRRVEFKRIK